MNIRQLDRLLGPEEKSSDDPLVPKCDCCPRDAKSFYRSRPRNSMQQPDYHAFCPDHDSPFSETDAISMEQYVVGYIHES